MSRDMKLRKIAARGGQYTAVSAFLVVLIHLAVLAGLARLLSPSHFGIFAVALVFVDFMLLLSRLGLNEAIIQRKNPSDNELCSLFWFSLSAGFLFYALLWLVAPFIAARFQLSELSQVLQVLGLIFIVSPVGMPYMALFHKKLEFKVIAWFDVIAALINAAVAIFCAWKLNMNFWALVWGRLAQAAAQAALYASWGMQRFYKPKLRLRFHEIREYLGFGAYRVGARLTNALSNRLDQLFVGGILGSTVLGYYNMAVRIAWQPVQRLNPIFNHVAFPVFVRVEQDRPRAKRGFLQMIRFSTMLSAPILFGIAGTAPAALPYFLGDAWRETVPLVQAFAFYALISSIMNFSAGIILAAGWSARLFLWRAGILSIVAPLVLAGCLTGRVINIVYLLLAFHVPLIGLHYILFLKKLMGPCFKEYFQAAFVPIMSGAVMGLSVYLVPDIAGEMSALSTLSLQAASGALVYGFFTLIFMRKDLYSAWKSLTG